MTWSIDTLRDAFPVLTREVGGVPLAYLDNAATAQVPRRVGDRIHRYLLHEKANIHRGAYALSVEATRAYDEARERVGRFINAPEAREIVFVRGATEGINLVARSFVIPRLREGDEILVTVMEHHANLVPWQMAAAERGAVVRAVPVTDRGEIDLEAFRAAIGDRTRMCAFTHVSNVLGTVNPVRELVAAAAERGVPTLVDGAQAVPHRPVDVASIGCDFYVFSGHKLFGPDGIGVLWGRAALLEAMPPYQGGGDMIERVSLEEGTTFRTIPERFEAGTPNISGAIGLGEAVAFLGELDPEAIERHESGLLEAATRNLRAIEGLRIFGDAPGKVAVVSFTVDGVHPHDLATVLDARGICIRAGHHCAQPLMRALGVPATARASFAFYNTHDEVERLSAAVREAVHLFR